jgi:hypothetical protein
MPRGHSLSARTVYKLQKWLRENRARHWPEPVRDERNVAQRDRQERERILRS